MSTGKINSELDTKYELISNRREVHPSEVPGGKVVEKGYSSQQMTAASSQRKLFVGAVVLMQCYQQASQKHLMTAHGASFVPPIFSVPAF